MRILSVLSLVFMLGCGAAANQHGNTTPEGPPPVVLTTDCLEVTAPAGWSVQPGPRTTEQEDYSSVALVNEQGRELAILHPHGDVEYADSVFLNNYMRTSMLAAMSIENPDMLAEGITSFRVSELAEVEEIRNGYMYVISITLQDGNSENNLILLMPLVPEDVDTTVLVSVTSGADEGEEFLAEVLEIVRSLRYTCAES